MRKPRQFRPLVSDARLEERVVLSASVKSVLHGPAVLPVVTSNEITQTLNGLHAALVSFQRSAQTAILYAESQVNAGNITSTTAVSLLEGYLGNKLSLWFYQNQAASTKLPYGGGFNGYVNSTNTTVSELPSGASSLYSLLTFPTSSDTEGPVETFADSIFTPLSAGDFAGAYTAASNAAVATTYQQIKLVVTTYVADGIKAHDFT